MVRWRCTRVLLDYVSLDIPRCCQSVTVSDDVRLSFGLPAARLRLPLLRWSQGFASATRGSCLTTSLVAVKSVTVSTDARLSFDLLFRSLDSDCRCCGGRNGSLPRHAGLANLKYMRDWNRTLRAPVLKMCVDYTRQLRPLCRTIS